jgi:hypothetical protein
MNKLDDPLAIAKALGVYETEEPRAWWKIPRRVEIDTIVVVLSGYALVTLGVYIGLIVHP